MCMVSLLPQISWGRLQLPVTLNRISTIENEWMDVRRQQSCHLGSQSKSHWSVDKSDMHSRFVFLDNSACGCFNRTFVSLVY